MTGACLDFIFIALNNVCLCSVYASVPNMHERGAFIRPASHLALY